MVTVPHEMVGLEGMLDYRGVGLQGFHCYMSYQLIILSTISIRQTSIIAFGMLSSMSLS